MIDSERYFLTCQRYVELKPVRAALVSNPADYPWSSYRCSVLGLNDPLITPHETFAALGRDDDERRGAYGALCSQPMAPREIEKIREATNKGWPLGSETFVNRIEIALGRPARPQKRGPKPAAEGGPAPSPGCPQLLI